eukprot:6808386-Ditylum_brightwellii.AAC.1
MSWVFLVVGFILGDKCQWYLHMRYVGVFGNQHLEHGLKLREHCGVPCTGVMCLEQENPQDGSSGLGVRHFLAAAFSPMSSLMV